MLRRGDTVILAFAVPLRQFYPSHTSRRRRPRWREAAFSIQACYCETKCDGQPPRSHILIAAFLATRNIALRSEGSCRVEVQHLFVCLGHTIESRTSLAPSRTGLSPARPRIPSMTVARTSATCSTYGNPVSKRRSSKRSRHASNKGTTQHEFTILWNCYPSSGQCE
jgi:hypothetical protein